MAEQTNYILRVKSQAWTPEHGIEQLDFAVAGLGNNVQLRMGMPNRKPVDRNDQPPAMYLATGEWISFRGKFAEAEDVARAIVKRGEDQLAEVARDARAFGWDEVANSELRVSGPALT